MSPPGAPYVSDANATKTQHVRSASVITLTQSSAFMMSASHTKGAKPSASRCAASALASSRA